ncbi:hypothetical protein CAPTEDRAFT_205434 [Capitella teleta]|uniref:Uncharacterized protein n=1 Tax=Capitella teleta TaxID=283909 RepID=R7TU19_CAPTE|nr:hypothetical protein CAPTEDRAFT_205434 [Capitella teleta]|eukprot:ELT97393.1 hypothetical protein CAPTEDRAFT_205434 [Capitella teleta]
MAEQQQVIKQSHFSPLAAVSNFVKFVTHEWVSRKLEEGVDPSSLAKQLKGNENLGYSNYQESSLGKQFTGEELEANLLEVLCLNVDEEEAISSDLPYRNEKDIYEAMDHKKASLSSKLAAARRARQAEQAKTLLPALLKDPSSLVEKRVVHHVHNPGEAAECCVVILKRFRVAAILDYGGHLGFDLDQNKKKIEVLQQKTKRLKEKTADLEQF